MSELTRAGLRLPESADLRRRVTGRVDRVTLISLVFGIGLAAFLAIEPTQDWLLLLLAGLVTLGVEGILRTHLVARRYDLDQIFLHLLTPATFALVIGLFAEEFITGYWTVPAGLAMALPFGAIVNAEYHSISQRGRLYMASHLILNATIYVTAFLAYVTIYDYDLDLWKIILSAGTISLLLSAGVLREEAESVAQLLIYTGAVGMLVAQTALAVHFLPLEGGSAAVFLLLVFYSMTGLLHHYLRRDIDWLTIVEFLAISLAGLGMIAVSRTYL